MNSSESLGGVTQNESPRRKYIEKLKEHALSELSYRFDRHPKGIDSSENREAHVLEFHSSQHTKDIIRRTKTILEAIQVASPELVNDEVIENGEIAAAFHDIVQEWKGEIVTDEMGNGPIFKIIRRKDSEKNELASAETALNFIDRLEEETGETLFSPQSRQQIQEAILATVPSFKDGTAIQKNLTEKSSVVARALALADIGAAGMDGEEAFNTAGDALFREDNVDISRAVTEKDLLSERHERYFAIRMKNWSNGQVAFAEGRKRLFESEIAPLPKPAQDAVRAVFSKFDKTIESAKAYAEKRAQMTFKELAIDFGYTV